MARIVILCFGSCNATITPRTAGSRRTSTFLEFVFWSTNVRFHRGPESNLEHKELDMVFLSLHKLRKCKTVILREVAVRTNKDGKIFCQLPVFRGYNGYFFWIPK
ncbi:Abc superfamily atp binding cassette abc protein [Striga asiatica]|uniref:Abc superfamily atp binding cassette abc protein n=1 Tax=Striga asiatica TaxID=4170 RepID=A0A5A7P045_STRAF|nr:Abc superfamily atp binding cassette abc protein [Striga asiatica]